jgi:hypothetical protein
MRSTVHIRILEDLFETDADDTLLFALQRYARKFGLPTYGFTRFCWNSSCHQCVVKLHSNGVGYRDHACQAPVEEGLQVQSVPRVLHWRRKSKAGSES